MSYEDLIPLLRSAHLYPVSVIKNGKVVELQITVSPLIHESAMKIAKEVVGNGYKTDWLPNESYISITKKK